MGTIETKVYKFNELSDTAKENAIDRLRNINVDYDWWEDDFLLDIVSPKKISKKITPWWKRTPPPTPEFIDSVSEN